MGLSLRGDCSVHAHGFWRSLCMTFWNPRCVPVPDPMPFLGQNNHHNHHRTPIPSPNPLRLTIKPNPHTYRHQFRNNDHPQLLIWTGGVNVLGVRWCRGHSRNDDPQKKNAFPTLRSDPSLQNPYGNRRRPALWKRNLKIPNGYAHRSPKPLSDKELPISYPPKH